MVSEIHWTRSKGLFKHPGKVGGVLKACLVSDFRDREIGVLEEQGTAANSQIPKMSNGRFIEMLSKKSDDMRAGNADRTGHLLQIQWIGKVLVQVGQDPVDTGRNSRLSSGFCFKNAKKLIIKTESHLLKIGSACLADGGGTGKQ